MRIKGYDLFLEQTKSLKLKCLGCHRKKKKEFPGKVNKYGHVDQPLKVMCFAGLFHNAQQLIRFWTNNTKLLNSTVFRNSKWNRNSGPWHASGAGLQFQPQPSDYSASSVASQLLAYRRIAEVSSETSQFAQPNLNISYFLKHEADDFSGTGKQCPVSH